VRRPRLVGSSPNHSQIPVYQSPQSISWPPQSGSDCAAVPRTSGMGGGQKQPPGNRGWARSRRSVAIILCSDIRTAINYRPRSEASSIFSHATAPSISGRSTQVPERGEHRTFSMLSQALSFLIFECCPWRVPEGDRQPVVGIHQADRDREIDQFLLLKDRAHSLERFIRDARL
jgi:hypothetical protein